MESLGTCTSRDLPADVPPPGTVAVAFAAGWATRTRTFRRAGGTCDVALGVVLVDGLVLVLGGGGAGGATTAAGGAITGARGAGGGFDGQPR